MRWNAFIRYAVAFSVLFGTLLPEIAQAQNAPGASGQVTLSATVLEHRGIIVDADQKILEIYSNTDNKVVPTVVVGNYGGPTAPLTPRLTQDYEQIMAQVGHDHALVIKRAKETLPANLFEPEATVLYTATPATRHQDSSVDKPYFIRLNVNSLVLK